MGRKTEELGFDSLKYQEIKSSFNCETGPGTQPASYSMGTGG